jgi:hypothetical protein
MGPAWSRARRDAEFIPADPGITSEPLRSRFDPNAHDVTNRTAAQRGQDVHATPESAAPPAAGLTVPTRIRGTRDGAVARHDPLMTTRARQRVFRRSLRADIDDRQGERPLFRTRATPQCCRPRDRGADASILYRPSEVREERGTSARLLRLDHAFGLTEKRAYLATPDRRSPRCHDDALLRVAEACVTAVVRAYRFAGLRKTA